MKKGDIVTHPKYGRGTVVFDKPHCIQVQFMEPGKVNFSQALWSKDTRPLTTIPDIEYRLASLVEDGLITEEQGLAYLDANPSRLEHLVSALPSKPDEGE